MKNLKAPYKHLEPLHSPRSMRDTSGNFPDFRHAGKNIAFVSAVNGWVGSIFQLETDHPKLLLPTLFCGKAAIQNPGVVQASVQIHSHDKDEGWDLFYD